MKVIKIDINNISDIEHYVHLCVHDQLIAAFEIDQFGKSICLKFTNRFNSSHNYQMDFIDVIGIEMTFCDFWGPPNCVFEFFNKVEGEKYIIPRLLKKWAETPNANVYKNNLYSDFIEVQFTFSCGDFLTIACKQINFTEIAIQDKTGDG